METFEYEAHLATHEELHAGIVIGEVRKYLVAAENDTEGYHIAMDFAWAPGEREVTALYWVP
jgi:hypothetical protein